MKKLIHIFMLLFAFTIAQAQTVDDKAKAYYQEAQKAFESKNYKQTIDYCQQVTDLLKNTNARIELLRIKSYYELGEYGKVNASIKTFTNLPASAELKNETLEYLVKVEKAEKAAEDKRLAEQRKLEQERIAKEQKIAEEKRQKEQVERERLDHERSLKAEEQRREESGLLLAGKWKGVNKTYSTRGTIEREFEDIHEIIIEEKGNVITLSNNGAYVFPGYGGVEAKLVSEQGDKKIYTGSKRVRYEGKYSIECTYSKKDKTLKYVLTKKNGSSILEHYGTFKMQY